MYFIGSPSTLCCASTFHRPDHSAPMSQAAKSAQKRQHPCDIHESTRESGSRTTTFPQHSMMHAGEATEPEPSSTENVYARVSSTTQQFSSLLTGASARRNGNPSEPTHRSKPKTNQTSMNHPSLYIRHGPPL